LRKPLSCNLRTGHLRGLTLIEVLIAVVILGIVGVAAGVGLQSAANVSGGVDDRLWISQQLSTTVEKLHDTPYASLSSGSTVSDSDRNGKTYVISWTVLEIDPAAPTASPPVAKTASGLKQISVTLNGSTLITWISQ
jgi:prepilin-type N-terminal cleavage/methylation domain-containing protein